MAETVCLKAVRLRSEGKSQEEIAKALGLSRTRVRQLLSAQASKEAASAEEGNETITGGNADRIWRMARAAREREKAEQEKLNTQRMAGKLVRADALRDLVQSIREKFASACAQIERLPGGHACHEILDQAAARIEEDAARILHDCGAR